MANTPEGAKKAVETTRKKYGDDFFKMRAAKAGRASKTGFVKGDPKARAAGLKGAAAKHKLGSQPGY